MIISNNSPFWTKLKLITVSYSLSLNVIKNTLHFSYIICSKNATLCNCSWFLTEKATGIPAVHTVEHCSWQAPGSSPPHLPGA